MIKNPEINYNSKNQSKNELESKRKEMNDEIPIRLQRKAGKRRKCKKLMEKRQENERNCWKMIENGRRKTKKIKK